jgi:hypothetical protein
MNLKLGLNIPEPRIQLDPNTRCGGMIFLCIVKLRGRWAVEWRKPDISQRRTLWSYLCKDQKQPRLPHVSEVSRVITLPKGSDLEGLTESSGMLGVSMCWFGDSVPWGYMSKCSPCCTLCIGTLWYLSAMPQISIWENFPSASSIWVVFPNIQDAWGQVVKKLESETWTTLPISPFCSGFPGLCKQS